MVTVKRECVRPRGANVLAFRPHPRVHPPALVPTAIASNTRLCQPLFQNVARPYRIDTASSSHSPFLVSYNACNTRLCHPLCQKVARPYHTDTNSSSLSPFLVSCDACNTPPCHLPYPPPCLDTACSSHLPFLEHIELLLTSGITVAITMLLICLHST